MNLTYGVVWWGIFALAFAGAIVLAIMLAVDKRSPAEDARVASSFEERDAEL